MRTTEQKFREFESEIAGRKAARFRPVPAWHRLAASAALLVAGALLYALPGRFPPPAWRELYRLARGSATLPLAGLLMTAGRSLALLVAWILLLYVAMRVAQLWRREEHRQLVQESRLPARAEDSGEGSEARGGAGQKDDNTPLHWQETEVSQLQARAEVAESGAERGPGGGVSRGEPLVASLLGLVIDSSAPSPGRPALPALCVGPVDPAVIGNQPWAEGVGMAVGSCCHPGNGPSGERLQDTLLVSSGLRLFPGALPSLLPVGVFMVADGIALQGGRPTGSVGRMAVGELCDALLPTLVSPDPLPRDDLKQLVCAGMQQANARLYQLAAGGQQEGGTTLTAALVMGMTACIANVGDSRAYLYRAREGLMQITFAHTAPDGEAEDRTPAEKRRLGVERETAADLLTVQLEIGDMLLLCTDGLWRYVAPALLEQTMQWFARAPVADPSRLCSILREAALEGGGTDHLSVVVAQITPLSREGWPAARVEENGANEG